MLGGSLAAADNRIDPGRLCARHGVEHVVARGFRLDRTARLLTLEDGGALPYDRVSFNTGSRVRLSVERSGDAYVAKPLADLLRLRRDILADRLWERRILVVGGGATGVEIAGNLMRLGRAAGRPLGVTLVAGGERLLEGLPTSAGRIAAKSLREAGVRLVFDAKVVSAGGGEALLTSGARLAFERIVQATGLTADLPAGGTDLPTGPDGGLLVGETLACAADPRVFAVGDCASIAGFALSEAGVHGVRAAPVLAGNLLASLTNKPLRRFRPQETWLSILDLGDGTGLGIRGPLVLHGRAVLRWKRRIDRRFLDRYR